MEKKILFTLDGSAFAEAALPYATALAPVAVTDFDGLFPRHGGLAGALEVGASTRAAGYLASIAERPRGLGPKVEERLGREAARAAQRAKRMPLDVALSAAEQVISLLRKSPPVLEAEPAGSVRRMQETIGDIDILVASQRPVDATSLTSVPNGFSNCLPRQELRPSSGSQPTCLRMMALRMTSSLCIQAVSATFLGLPAWTSR